MALGFSITPEQRRAFEADQWAQPHLEALADDWQAQAFDRLNQPPTPSDSLTNPLGTGNMSAGPEADIVSSPPAASPSPVEPDQPAPAPLPVPSALPAPDAPPPTDYGPVPRSTPAQRPIAAPPSVPSPTVAPTPVPAGNLVDYARQAAQRAGIDPDLFVSQINQESGFIPGRVSAAGARGIAQIVPRWHPGVNPDNPTEALDYAANLMAQHLKTYGGDIRTALVAYNGGQGAVQALQAGTPYRESVDYVTKILGGVGTPGNTVASAPATASLSLSQFGDQTLTADEAYSACGPAAAARLAAEYGNAIPLSAALAAAKTTGWTQAGGMNGILNEKKLLDALGLPAELDTSKDWNKIIQGASAGQLVTISTPGHYFQANAARQRSDGQTELYVGQSGKDLKVGKEWMTPGEMEAAMGALNGALFSDPSKAVTAGDWYQGAIRDHGIPRVDPNAVIGEIGQAAKKAGLLPAPDETVSNPFGEAFRQIGAVKDQVGGAIGGALNTAFGSPLAQSMQAGQEAQTRGTAQAAEGVGEAAGNLLNAAPQGSILRGGLNVANAAIPATDSSTATMRPGGALALQAEGDFQRQRTADDIRAQQLGQKQVDGTATPEEERWLANYAVSSANVLGSSLKTGPINPATVGGKANQTLLNMYGSVKTAPTNAVPSQLEEARRFLVRKWTDRGVDLAEFQKDAERAAGRPLTPDEMAYEMRRLNPSGAAQILVQNELKPAVQSVGEDADWLKVYLTHQDNIDVAKAMGQRVEQDIASRPLGDVAGEMDLRRVNAAVQGQQRQLDNLRSTGAPSDVIAAAQSRLAKTINQQTTLAQKLAARVQAASQEQTNVARMKGVDVQTQRQFSGGLTIGDSEAGLQEMAQQLGPQRMAKIEQAADQIWDYGKTLLQRKVDAGLISQDLFDELTTKYPHYSPTRIVDYLKDPANIPSGRKITVQSSGLKRNTLEGTVRQREDPLSSFVRLADETEALATKNEVAQAFLKLRDLTPDGNLMIREVADDVATPRGFEKMKVFTDGTPQTYVMPDYIAKAIREEPVAPIPILAPMMNLFRALATQRNPVFLASNALNDAATYTLRSSSRLGGPQNAPKVVGELIRTYGDAFQGLFQGEYRGAATQRYIGGGGAMSGFFSRRPEDAAKVAGELQRSNVFEIRSGHAIEDVKRLIGQALTLKPVEAIGERIELAPRVAAMRLAENAGASQAEAVLAGRTVTIDFSQGGTWAKTLNQVIPFFNVAVQSGTQIPRAFRENPKGFAATALTMLAAPTVGIEAWNRSDPQRAKDYEDVPQYVKDAGMVFMLPTASQTDEKGNRKPQYLFFPTREFSPFVVLTREAAGRAMGAEPRAWAELLMGAAKSVSPIQGESGAEAISTFVPLGVSTGMQLATNRDWFRNRDIVSQQADEQASALSKTIAAALQKMGVEARPSAVEFGIRDVGAGVAGSVLAASDAVAGRPRRDERIQSTPGAGGLIGRFVQDRTGERLSRAIDQPVPVDIERALKESGVAVPTLPSTISVRNQMTGNNSPPIELHQNERADYQRLMADRLSERLRPMLADPKWSQRPIETRNKLLEAQVKAAREYAESRVYASMAPEDRQRRMQAGREAQRPKPKP